VAYQDAHRATLRQQSLGNRAAWPAGCSNNKIHGLPPNSLFVTSITELFLKQAQMIHTLRIICACLGFI
jgi:hypothetical protein